MNKELECEFEKIISYIKESDTYLEYLKLNKKMSENEKIVDLVKDVKKFQKQIVKLEYNKEDYSEVEKIYNEKLAELESIPLYQKFIVKQQEVNQMVQFVKERIETYLDEVSG